MYKIRTFTVVPAVPEPLTRLRELAYNLWWSWNADARALYRRLDPELWDDVTGNPIKLLAHVSQHRLDQAAQDGGYLAGLNRVMENFDRYMARKAWFQQTFPKFGDDSIAYFSMEFGIHECLPIYSGGLGLLAGDHLKSASDLGLPLVGVGLLYRQGYFQQRLATDGWQIEDYPTFDFYQAPVTQEFDEHGRPIRIQVELGDQPLYAHVWRIQVGRVPLYLLDSDIADNPYELRDITSRLYGGDEEMRIRQEILLGIGGIRALDALKRRPTVCHMNEGHAAYLALERIRQCMNEQGMDFGEAREAVMPGNIFTTHTPVPAGIDHFESPLLKKYMTHYLATMHLSLSEFEAIGKVDAADPREQFSMAVLALRLAGMANGVSALHGHVSRKMWHNVWPGAPKEEVPITSITNGIHTETWIAPEMAHLLDSYLGPSRVDRPEDDELWERVDDIPDVELWRVHERRRLALVAFSRRRLREQLRRRGAPPTEIKAAEECLDPEALTIGFARRFAPYKRGDLIFRNPDRLLKLLSDVDRPVQFIFAGKAHPRDGKGKEIIKSILAYINRPEFRRRIIFLENYDITVGRMLVQGVDVWLNNPIKPREASGTSGMKVGPNGGINFSVLDGWWPEGYDGENGWAIDEGRIVGDAEFRDHVESETIYEMLEKEISPMFYDRGADNLPRRWIKRMKASMKTVSPRFSTARMVQEYASKLYVPTAERRARLSAESFSGAKKLSHWKRDLAHEWGSVAIDAVNTDDHGELSVGTEITVRAKVRLGKIDPESVAVELYHGRVDPGDELVEGQSQRMDCNQSESDGTYWFSGRIPCIRSGQHGYAIRIIPQHADLPHRFDTGLIRWG
ncbi:MAG: alpha-glucan family phosphorylase [Phycisphaerales bacterium]|nr:alpha-glucan family phosphorylase [Phycisphaerales bacterium]MCB9856915.1 alpha-glucan family phosphorylase [Phycisphaerales bacterium]MCB9861958.1 alpha-glucan family phosphorylase [Phycisphaerales bacterium]